MAEASAIKRYLIGQFGRPHGPIGWLAGRIMAARGSNRLRNRWTVDLMGLQPAHRVLEIGHGPGLALAEVCARLDSDRAVGLDHSRGMHIMAQDRNHAAVGSGRLTLRTGSAELPATFDDPALAGPFDRIFAINVAMFWHDPVAVLRQLKALLDEAGGIYLTFQPRTGTRTDAAALAAAEMLGDQMRAAGLAAIRIEKLTALSPMAVCVTGSVNR